MGGDSEILFLPKRNARMELYTGKKLTAEDSNTAQATGFVTVMDIEQYEPQLFRRLEKPRKIFADFSAPHAEKYKSVLSLRKTEDARPLVTRLRMKKSANEIAMIEPARWCRMTGTTCFAAITNPRRLIVVTVSNAASVISSGDLSPPPRLTPTL